MKGTHALLGLATAAGLSACPSPMPTGGPCRYEPVSGPCFLVGHEEGARDQQGVHYFLRYRTNHPIREVTHSMFVNAGHEDELPAFLEKHQEVECSGEVIVTGTCNPESMSIEVPSRLGPTAVEEAVAEMERQRAGPEAGATVDGGAAVGGGAADASSVSD